MDEFCDEGLHSEAQFYIKTIRSDRRRSTSAPCARPAPPRAADAAGRAVPMQRLAVTALQQQLLAVSTSLARHRRIYRAEYAQVLATARIDQLAARSRNARASRLACAAERNRASRVNGGQRDSSRSASASSATCRVAALDAGCVQNGCAGNAVCIITSPCRLSRPARPATWMIDCASRSVATKVGAEQALVGVNDADQRQLRKVMTFRQHLRANENIGITLLGRRAVQHRSRRAAACCRCRCVARHAPGNRCSSASSSRSVPVAERFHVSAARGTAATAAATARHSDGSATSGQRAHALSCVSRSARTRRAGRSLEQIRVGAKPRRLRNSSTWPPAPSCCSIAAAERRAEPVAAGGVIQRHEPHRRRLCAAGA